MNVLSFVNNLPADKGYTYCPIYAKNATMLSGRKATGKNPDEASYERKFGPADVALVLERNPEKFKACGLFTGVRGNGIVILDIDRNLSEVLKKHKDSLDGAPLVTSTKKDAAKYIFRVPEELWPEVKGHGLSEQSGGNYELLWGRQGLICGEYPGHKATNSPAGQYKFHGSLDDVPIAPNWIIAEMKASKHPETTSFRSKDLDFSDRTEDEIIEIVRDCLGVISPQGAGSRDHWIRVGMAIHSVLPNEIGLMIWSAWSAEDPDFAHEWENENPCETPFWSFSAGGIGLGTLIWLADREDPERTRFSEHTKKVVEAAENRQVQSNKQATISHELIIERAKNIKKLENPSEQDHALHALSMDAGYMREGKSQIENLLKKQRRYEKGSELMTVRQLMELEDTRDFTIPGILPAPFVILLYGSGGDGKSMTTWTLAKHIATGAPFLVKDKLMPVEKGPVLILNGDQSRIQLKEQMEDVDYPVDNENTFVHHDWSLQNYDKFCDLMEKIRPKLVIIDSLVGCSGGAFDENKSDFANPLYDFALDNGTLFPATTIIIIHHANKNGGFRGTTAIRDAVDETWALKKPDEKMLARVGAKARLIEVEKSRLGRTGKYLILKEETDSCFTLGEFTPDDSENYANLSLSEKIVQKLRSVYPHARSRSELYLDPLVGQMGAVNSHTIRRTLQRLKTRRLIEVAESSSTGDTYRAIFARGEGAYSVSPSQDLSDGASSGVRHPPETPTKCPTPS